MAKKNFARLYLQKHPFAVGTHISARRNRNEYQSSIKRHWPRPLSIKIYKKFHPHNGRTLYPNTTHSVICHGVEISGWLNTFVCQRVLSVTVTGARTCTPSTEEEKKSGQPRVETALRPRTVWKMTCRMSLANLKAIHHALPSFPCTRSIRERGSWKYRYRTGFFVTRRVNIKYTRVVSGSLWVSGRMRGNNPRWDVLFGVYPGKVDTSYIRYRTIDT